MYALTLWQPWSWAVAHAGKRVENRSWKPPKRIIGQQIAIHAGKRLDKEAAQLLAFDFKMPSQLVVGAVESIATLTGWVSSVDERNDQAPWFQGPVGWELSDIIVLPKPVPCRGAQGIWLLPTVIEKMVISQIGKSKAE